MLEFDIPSIITSNPLLVLPIPYLQPVTFDVTNKFVSKCFVILFTGKIVFPSHKLAGTTNISAKLSSMEFFSKKLSISKSKSHVFLLYNVSMPIMELSSILIISKDAPESNPSSF